MEKKINIYDRIWQWFIRQAGTHHLLWWLLLFAFCDGFISPFPTEFFLAPLMVARPSRWRQYLVVTILGSTAGVSVGYLVGRLLFRIIGQPIINFYHLQGVFTAAKHFLHGHVFLTMALMPFVIPIPEKVFIFAGGFLGVAFIPYITGYFLGHSIRLALVSYLAGRYGERVLNILKEYVLIIGLALLTIVVFYGMVHLHLLPL